VPSERCSIEEQSMEYCGVSEILSTVHKFSFKIPGVLVRF
jgi:hypothetical protein